MTYWISVSARDARDGPGVHAAAYKARVHDLVIVLNDILQRAFAGVRWLRRKYSGEISLVVELNAHSDGSIRVERLKNRNYGSAKQLRYRLWVPAVWFTVPGDGLLGIRLLSALLAVLSTVGTEHALGTPPPLRSVDADPGRPELIDLFAPRGSQQSRFAAAAQRLEELADQAEPEQLVLVGVDPVGEQVRQDREAVARALGVTEEESFIPVVEPEGVRVWKLRRSV